jgi:hypothetical protein
MDSIAYGGRGSDAAAFQQKDRIGGKCLGPRNDNINGPDKLRRYMDRLTDARIVREAQRYHPIVGDRDKV